jgi:hypothetical protein
MPCALQIMRRPSTINLCACKATVPLYLPGIEEERGEERGEEIREERRERKDSRNDKCRRVWVCVCAHPLLVLLDCLSICQGEEKLGRVKVQ